VSLASIQKSSASQASPKRATVTVVIPAYNAAEFLAETLDSVLAQTYPPLEVIVVDDGSEDETPRIVAAYEGKVTYIHKPHGRGCGGPRNVGIRAASGEWVGFQDADDIWKPTFLEELVETAVETGADVVFCDYMTLSEGEILGPSSLESTGMKPRLGALGSKSTLRNPFDLLLKVSNFIPASGVMVRKRSLLEAGLFDEGLHSCEDLDLWLRLTPKHRFAVVNEVLMLRRKHARNMTHDRWTMLTSEIAAYEKTELYAPALVPGNRWRKALRKKKVPLLREQGALYMKRGEALLARKSWAKGLRSSYSPRLAAYWLATFLPRPWIEALRNAKRHVVFALTASSSLMARSKVRP